MKPTRSMQIFGEMQRKLGIDRRRSEAARKAWRTRRRLAKPTKVMRVWLEWLAARPANVIVQRREDNYGSLFSFGAYPEGSPGGLFPPAFTRNTFFALQRRGWVERAAETEPFWTGSSWESGVEKKRYGRRIYWRIAEKGKKALAAAGV